MNTSLSSALNAAGGMPGLPVGCGVAADVTPAGVRKTYVLTALAEAAAARQL